GRLLAAATSGPAAGHLAGAAAACCRARRRASARAWRTPRNRKERWFPGDPPPSACSPARLPGLGDDSRDGTRPVPVDNQHVGAEHGRPVPVELAADRRDQLLSRALRVLLTPRPH